MNGQMDERIERADRFGVLLYDGPVPSTRPGIRGPLAGASSFDPEFQANLRNRVLLAGGGSMIRGLDTAIEKAMQRDLGGGELPGVDPPEDQQAGAGLGAANAATSGQRFSWVERLSVGSRTVGRVADGAAGWQGAEPKTGLHTRR